MAQRIHAESEAASKLFLSHAELRSNGPHVDHGRHMDPVIAFVRLATGIRDRLFQAAADAVSNLAHFRCVLPVLANSSVSRRKSFRSFWLKSAFSFLA